jgi:tetratricopeptide (TPR) repeat protein
MPLRSEDRPDWLRIGLIVLALAYALLAGLHTVTDLDLGWQLATGRYLIQHHQIPRVELFSYTAQGKEWIYPPFSGVIFYLLYLLGGYSALSWLSAIACAATIAFLVASGGRFVAALAIVAVPAIAYRTVPRADLFTTVLFAVVLSIIWRNYRGKPAPLWLLPVLFLLWANLHLGFISGLALLGAAVFFDLSDMLFAERRASAVARVKQLVPWIAASFTATLINPWGWRLYEAIYRQNKVMQIHSAFIGEWSPVHIGSLALRQAVDASDPASADWWLLVVAALAILVALSKKHFGPAIVLAAGIVFSLQHIRLQGILAILAVVIGGTLLSDFARDVAARGGLFAKTAESANTTVPPRVLSPRMAYIILTVFVVLVGLRVADLVTDRYYFDSAQTAFFGAGPSWWYPESAAAFLKREGLPTNVFHDYDLGGYLTWSIGPEYRDFVDGRYIPFGYELFSEQRLLASLGPDTPEWQQAVDRWQINTAIFSVARYAGLGSFALQDFCASKSWTPVYLDDVAIIFVRNRPENAGLIGRLGIRCDTEVIPPPQAASGTSFRAKAEQFNYDMNTASIYFVLSRNREAASALDQAEALFPDDSNLHLVKAQLFASANHPLEAEQEYLRVVKTHPSDAAWSALVGLYLREHRYPDALRSVREAAPLSLVPYDRFATAGLLYLAMNQPKEALEAFDEADHSSPYRGESSEIGNAFNAKIAEGRARAYRQLNDLDHAVAQQKLATNLTPANSDDWAALADLYSAQGQTADSSQARLRAQSIQNAAQKDHKSNVTGSSP